MCYMGFKVFMNCVGFFKIDMVFLGDSIDLYIEVFDGFCVYFEIYEWVRKMVVDVLEYDELVEDVNFVGVFEEILENLE